MRYVSENLHAPAKNRGFNMCPPIYLWEDKKTKKQVQVIRSVAEIETPPTEEESGIASEAAEWTRQMCACKWVRGATWRYAKGAKN